jgi:hypothetical protein
MYLQKLNAQVLEMIEANPLITLVRSFTIVDNEDYLGLLVVEKSTPPMKEGEELSAFYFQAYKNLSPAAICTITPKEYKNIIDGRITLPKEWLLGNILFDGCLSFTDIDSLVKSINNWLYPVSSDDDPCRRVYGFKCASGRKWEIKLTDLKNSMCNSKLLGTFSFSTKEDKDKFIGFLNTKAPYEEIGIEV